MDFTQFNPYYSILGLPISFEEWASAREDYRRVDATLLDDGTWISTVWLGIDHSFSDGPPIIFETMVFDTTDEGLGTDRDMERYATLEEAKLGHQRMVEKWSRKKPEDS